MLIWYVWGGEGYCVRCILSFVERGVIIGGCYIELRFKELIWWVNLNNVEEVGKGVVGLVVGVIVKEV